MAGGGVGPLLLRAAALGGLSAAAWLLSGTSASASTEEPLKVETVVEALVQIETPAAPLTATETPAEAVETPQLLADPAGWATALTTQILDTHQPTKSRPIVVSPKEPEPEPEPEQQDDGPVLDFTGGSHGNTRSGTISNEAPPEVLQAKAQARAARIAAKAAAQLPPPPPPVPAVSVKKIEPRLHEVPLTLPAPKADPVPATEIWTAPGPDMPLPSPQPAPVTATASASSSHSDNSGGTRGVLAVLTSHNSLFPPSTWSVEERCDGRSPGSLPGLPSTSPD